MSNRPLPLEDLEHILRQASEAFAQLFGAHLFLTGGTGLFGHWLLESLIYANEKLQTNIRVTILTRDPESFRISSPHVVSHPSITLLEGNSRSFVFPKDVFTHVIHAATDSTRKQKAFSAYELAESMIDGTRRVLQFAKEARVERLLFVSSGAVYGRSADIPQIPETYSGSPNPLLPQSSYDEAKRMCENLCVTFAEASQLKSAIARCFAFVGPHLPLDKHFAIGNFLQAAINNQPIQIQGDGTPRRSWLYMADLAVWLWTILAKGEAGCAYNVGSDESYSILQAAKLVAEVLRPDGVGGSTLPIHVHGTADGVVRPSSYVPAIDRAHHELGLQVRIPFTEGILRTAAWHGYKVPFHVASQSQHNKS